VVVVFGVNEESGVGASSKVGEKIYEGLMLYSDITIVRFGKDDHRA
jgi:hypothetical protein